MNIGQHFRRMVFDGPIENKARRRAELQKQVQQYLDRGNSIVQLPPCITSDGTEIGFSGADIPYHHGQISISATGPAALS